MLSIKTKERVGGLTVRRKSEPLKITFNTRNYAMCNRNSREDQHRMLLTQEETLYVARGLEAKELMLVQPYLFRLPCFKNEKGFPPPLTIQMGLLRVLGRGGFFVLLDAQTSQVTAL